MNIRSKRTLLGALKVQIRQEGGVTIEVTGRKGLFGGTRFEVLIGGDDMAKATGFSTPRSVTTKTATDAYAAIETLIVEGYSKRNSVLYSVRGRLNDIARAIETPDTEAISP